MIWWSKWLSMWENIMNLGIQPVTSISIILSKSINKISHIIPFSNLSRYTSMIESHLMKKIGPTLKLLWKGLWRRKYLCFQLSISLECFCRKRGMHGCSEAMESIAVYCLNMWCIWWRSIRAKIMNMLDPY